MKFVKRTEEPKISNKYYIHTSKGGYNKCLIRDAKTGNCLPNCVGFSYGRALESWGLLSCTLSRANAENWYGTKDGYARGQTPKVGAIACWAQGKIGGSDGAGHIANVEEILPNGDIIVSESGYTGTHENGRYWKLTTIKKGYKRSGLTFQGFIYPPVEFDEEEYWTIGKYKLLADKAVRTAHVLNANTMCKLSSLNKTLQKECVVKVGKAYIKKNTIVAIKEIYNEKGRIWGKYGNYWIVLCNQDGTPQSHKI